MPSNKSYQEVTPMEPIYTDMFTITDLQCDRFGRLKPSAMAWLVQEMAGRHCLQLGLDWNTLAGKGMFWAIIRHSLRVSRMPQKDETIRLETWPMPTTRVAYPRNVVAFDADGNELFRSTSLWVLMDMESRAMILPGKSGVEVQGLLRGGELPAPGSIPPAQLQQLQQRSVAFTDLDLNGHMNNCRYLDWAADLLASDFHIQHSLRAFTLGYLAEAREADALQLRHQVSQDHILQLEITRPDGERQTRIFCAKVEFF